MFFSNSNEVSFNKIVCALVAQILNNSLSFHINVLLRTIIFIKSFLPAFVIISNICVYCMLVAGSLLAHSCQAAMLLAEQEGQRQSAAYTFGENIAYARQVRNSQCKNFCPVKNLPCLPGNNFASMAGENIAR